jgi:hypothetical protein
MFIALASTYFFISNTTGRTIHLCVCVCVCVCARACMHASVWGGGVKKSMYVVINGRLHTAAFMNPIMDSSNVQSLLNLTLVLGQGLPYWHQDSILKFRECTKSQAQN